MHINKSELLSKVLTNVLFVSIFIILFFFTYGSYIEKKIVVEQMVFLSKDIKNFFSIFGKNINDNISKKLNDIPMPNLETQDLKAKENNNKIKIDSLKFIVLFILVISIIVYFNYSKYGNNSYNLGNIISENLVILVGIGIIEFVFLTYFGSRYISINPNLVKLTILETLREKEII
jgi:hypothetical protein